MLTQSGGGLGDSELTIDALRRWAVERMPTYRVPTRLLVLEQVPKNAMGKVNKKELRSLFGE